MNTQRARRVALPALTCVAVVAAGGAVANATVAPVGGGAAGAASIAAAFVAPGTTVASASFVTTPPSGTPNGVYTGTLGPFFPTNGNSFGVLTTGDVTLADQPNTATNSGTADGGTTVRGNTDQDVTIEKIDLAVPSGANCLSFDFQFLSDEYPEYVNTQYNDAFIAELDTSTWTTAGSTISAPNNFAFDPSGDVISINSTGNTAFETANSVGTTYDGATPLLRAATPVTPGAHSLYLSIFDQGDQVYDSAAFLDNLVVGFAANPGATCTPGATQQTYTLGLTPATATKTTGTSHTVTATVATDTGTPATSGTVLYTVAGANPTAGTGAVAPNGTSTFTYTGANAGTDAIAACYDSTANGTCDTGEATGSASVSWSPPTTGATCNGLTATIVSGAKTVNGTAGNDVIVGGPAAQVINGLGGDDTICGGDGNDVLQGGAGNDWLDGEGGMDMVLGQAGNDIEHGGAMADKVGGPGNDPGNDQLFGDAGKDQCFGTTPPDTISTTCESTG